MSAMNKNIAFAILLFGLVLGSAAVLLYKEPLPTECTITLVLSDDSTVRVYSIYSEQKTTSYRSAGIYEIVFPRSEFRSIHITSDIMQEVEYVKLDGVDITKVQANYFEKTSGYTYYSEATGYGSWDIYLDNDHTVEISHREREPVQITYVASVNSDVFHRPSCHYVRRITASKEYFDSRESAIQSGRRPCKICRP